MRLAIFVLLSLCASVCLAERHLRDDTGSYQEINIKYPDSDFTDALNYVQSQLTTLCHLNAEVKVKSVKKAYQQLVQGTNYKIVFNVLNHKNKQITVNFYQALPENGKYSYEFDSCN